MKHLFILVTAIVLLAGCAGMGETSGASAGMGTSDSYQEASNLYFGD